MPVGFAISNDLGACSHAPYRTESLAKSEDFLDNSLDNLSRLSLEDIRKLSIDE